MRFWLLMLLVVLAGGGSSRAASLSLRLDHSMVPACWKVLAGDPQAVPELLGHPTVRMLSEGMRPESTFTPREFAEASRHATDEPRFSWKQLLERRDEVERLYRWIQSNDGALRSKSEKEATRFIVALPPSSSITAHLICGAGNELIFRYAELQRSNTDWPALPPRFLADLRRAAGARP